TQTGNRLLYTLRPDGTGLDSLRCEHESNAVREEAVELENGSIVFTVDKKLMVLKRGALHEARVGATGNSYRSPAAVEGQIVVAVRKTGSEQRYEIATISNEGKEEARTIYRDPKFNSIQPIVIAPHVVPRKFWSTLSAGSESGYFISLDSSNSTNKAQS